MAVINSPTGSFIPSQSFFQTEVNNVITSTSTQYSWDAQQNSSHDFFLSRITLIGSFTYAGGTPSGTVDQVRIDTDGNGIADLTVAYTFPQTNVTDLIDGIWWTFWNQVFVEADDITLNGSSPTPIRVFGFDGFSAVLSSVMQNDTATITTAGWYSGDVRTIFDLIDFLGGNDVLNFIVDGSSEIYGDASLAQDANSASGGADVIDYVNTTGTGITTIFGDFRNGTGATYNGGDDSITGTGGAFNVAGDMRAVGESSQIFYGGDDTIITSGAFDDTLSGDVEFIGNGITRNGGDDSIRAGDGDDALYGEYVTNTSSLSVGNVLNGGDDTLWGEGGNDQLFGQSGSDVLNGGSGNDTLNGGVGADAIDGGTGVGDVIDYSDASSGVSLDLAENDIWIMSSGGESDFVRNVEDIIGSGSNDTLTGNSLANVLEGGAGNDYLDGEDGSDTASYASAPVSVVLDLGISGLQGTIGAGDDTLVSIENLIGSEFDDTLFGNSGKNTINGGDGNDIILTDGATSGFSDPGSDKFFGGMGDDTIGFSLDGVGQSGVGEEHVMDGQEGVDTFVFETYTTGYTVDLEAAAFSDILSAQFVSGVVNFENISAGGGGDHLIGYANNPLVDHHFFGNAGNDTLEGGQGDDLLLGGGGDDLFIGGGGANTIEGGAHGTAGDTVSYATSNAGVFVDLGTGTASGGHAAGDKFLDVENLLGTNFADMLGGDSGDNSIIGSKGFDTLFGGKGADTIQGGSNDDEIYGGEDNDSLEGGSGKDTVDGDAGDDTVLGGGRGYRVGQWRDP